MERRHPNEWLVIQVVEEDELSEPTKSILVARAQSHDEAWDLAMDVPGDVFVEFSGPPLPEDVEGVFCETVQMDESPHCCWTLCTP